MDEQNYDSTEINQLIKTLSKLEKILNKKLSLKFAFLRGIAYGLGIVLGTTIVAGVLYAVLVRFVNPEIIQNMTLEAQVQHQMR